MVIVSGLSGSSFETAYFVMRDDSDTEKLGEEDIIERANSIIESCYADTSDFRKTEKKRSDSPIFPFFLGFLAGGLACAILAVLVAVL